MHRRHFLGAGAVGLAGLALAGPGRAQTMTGGRRFLFLNAEGGWDPLAVFAPLYGNDGIDMEPDSEPATIGGLPLVDSPRRPAVRRFFEKHADRCLVLNGVSVRSVNHETCQAVSLTGSTSDRRPDWATLLATGGRARYDLPHVVFSGPSFAGPHTVLVSRAEGLLDPLLDGELFRFTEPAVQPLSDASGRLVDRFLARRTAALAAAAPEQRHLVDLAEASRRARRLSDSRLEVDLRSGATTLSRVQGAIAALAKGVCRCASVGTGFDWDTHLDNSLQSPLFENLFDDLDTIIGLLATTPGPEGRPLAEDTIVVLTSEMARTPAYNGTGGRDHWPYTTMMLIGPGVTGGRVVGGYTGGFNGIGVHPSSGELDMDAAGIAPEDLGATLLALGDMDPAEVLPFARPLTGVMT